MRTSSCCHTLHALMALSGTVCRSVPCTTRPPIATACVMLVLAKSQISTASNLHTLLLYQWSYCTICRFKKDARNFSANRLYADIVGTADFDTRPSKATASGWFKWPSSRSVLYASDWPADRAIDKARRNTPRGGHRTSASTTTTVATSDINSHTRRGACCTVLLILLL